MRLCLDEHFSPRIARRLRELGHDADSVIERRDLRGSSDSALWARVQTECRALVTEDVRAFVALVHEAAQSGDSHFGLVVWPRGSPRTLDTTGVIVERLDELSRRFPGDDDFVDRVEWLQP